MTVLVESTKQVWYLVQSYPNPEGLRTLRTAIPPGVCDALRCLSLAGIRVTYAKVRTSPTSKTFKFIRKFEILRHGNGQKWTELNEDEWKTKWDGIITVQQDIDTPVNISAVIPATLFNELRQGQIASISHRLRPPTKLRNGEISTAFCTDLILDMPDGTQLNAADYCQTKLTPEIEIALPLRKTDAEYFFDDTSNTAAIRHTFLISPVQQPQNDQPNHISLCSTTVNLQLSPNNDDTSSEVEALLTHRMEISSTCGDNKWEYQQKNAVPIQNGIIRLPYFRISTSDSTQYVQSIHPWLNSTSINKAHPQNH